MDKAITLLLVILLVWCVCFRSETEGFKAFNKEKVDKMTEVLMKEENQKLFRPDGVYADAATKIHWVDPVTYYDLAKLHYDNKYTEQNVRKMFE